MRIIGGTGDKMNLTGPIDQAGGKMNLAPGIGGKVNLVGLLDGIRCKV